MGVVTELFGQHTDPVTGQTLPVYRYRLQHGDGVEVHLLSYGAGISAVLAPDRYGNKEHVVLGFDSLEGYLQHQYQGSTIGRFANRIKGGAFSLNGVQCQLTVNNGSNHLHGGTIGWDKRVWSGTVVADAVVFSLVSDAGDQGYPGTVMAQVKYTLEPPGRLTIHFTALTTASTPVSLTNHAFFNLGGHASGPPELLQHTVSLACDSYLPVTEDLIPIGEQRLVADTNFDFRTKTTFSAALDKVKGGLDHCFVSEKTGSGCLRRLAVFGHPPSGRGLELWTTTPALQVYTGNFLPTDGSMRGRGGAVYAKQGAFCCEPEELPDAVNQPSFPNCILNPGEIYNHRMMYNFTLIEEEK